MLKKINESIHGLKEIRILGNENFFYDRVFSNSYGLAEAMKMKDFVSSIPRYFLELIMIFFIVLLVIIYSYQDKGLELVVPILTMFSIAAIRLFPSINQIVSGITHVRFGRPAVDLLYKDLKDLNLYHESDGVDNTLPFEDIELVNVSFSYPTRDVKVIDNLSLKVSKGESIGIIGPSGSGKTTLLDIMLGLINIDKGKVLFNGENLNQNFDKWKSNIAYIPQNIFIIDDTIARNIALGVSEHMIDYAKLKQSVHQSKLSDLVKKMPKGMDTILGESGVQLSGGQRQRVALARAFYHNRDILVMDEATSALDNEIEKEIVNEIKDLKGKKTLIVIAHRLSTVEHCDYIYKIDRGVIVKKGNFKSVVSES
jgi:ATP-binding cassette subfamily C protein